MYVRDVWQRQALGFCAPPIYYKGTKLAYVDVFKYVGVLFSDDGSFRHQEEAVTES